MDQLPEHVPPTFTPRLPALIQPDLEAGYWTMRGFINAACDDPQRKFTDSTKTILRTVRLLWI